MEKHTGKKFITQGKHREFYVGWNVATLSQIKYPQVKSLEIQFIEKGKQDNLPPQMCSLDIDAYFS